LNKSECIEGEVEGVEDKCRDVAGKSVSSEGKNFRVRVIFLRVIYYLFVALDKFYLLEKKFESTRNKHMSGR